MTKLTNPLCNWLRELTLELLRKEGAYRHEYENYTGYYTLEEYWLAFAFGLGGECVCELEGGDYWYEEANREGLIVREQLSPYAQEVLEDILAATPVFGCAMQYDDYLYLRDNWGSLTETASELGLDVPTEVEELKDERIHA